MESTQTTQSETTIISCGEKFIRKTYNGVSILVREKDGFVNATKICKDNRKSMKEYMKLKKWGEIIERYTKKLCGGNSIQLQNGLHYELKGGYLREIEGTWVHHRLVHYVAEWANMDYAIEVEEMMGSVDKVVQKELEQKKLPDTVENAKPIVQEVVKKVEACVDRWEEYNERQRLATEMATNSSGEISWASFYIYEKQLSDKMW
jgi:hypothetical protein